MGLFTASIKEVNGSGAGTPTTSTTFRFCTTDSQNPLLTYTLKKPATGETNYSYVKTFYLNADVAGSGTLNNIKWYTDGTVGWTGVVIKVKTSTTYSQATGTPNVTGDAMADGVDASTYTSASPLSVAGTITASTGKISDYVLVQAEISSSATAMTLPAETITWRYDDSSV